MAMEEQVEQKSQQALETAARVGATVSVQVSESLARQLIRSAGWAIKQGGRKLADNANSGKVSEARLQKITGGDIHDLKFDPQTMREVTRSLRQSGVTYAVEKIDDDHWRLMFTGKDQDHVRIAMERAFQQLGLTFDFHQAVEPDIAEHSETPETPSEPAHPSQQTRQETTPQTQRTTTDDAMPGTPDNEENPEQTRAQASESTAREHENHAGRTGESTAGQASREPQKHSDRPRTPGSERKTGKRTKKEFLAQLHQRANEKLNASRQAPELTKNKTRSK